MSGDDADTTDGAEHHLRWLEALAEAPERLLDFDEGSLNRLRRAAGKVALPDRMSRRKLAN